MTFLEEVYQKPEALSLLIDNYFNNDNKELNKLEQILRYKDISKVVFTGMGSSLFASYIPCIYLREKGINAFALESSELLKYNKIFIDGDTLLIAVSQSGESEEVVELCREFKNHESMVIVTNYTNSTLYKYGKAKLQIFAGREYTTASKTYTNTIAALIFLAHVIAGKSSEEINRLRSSLLKCVDLMKRIIQNEKSWVKDVCDVIGNSTYIPVTGSGPSYSTASHGELVLEEAGRIYSSRYTIGQFLHGPIELIDENFSAVVLDFNEKGRGSVDRVLKNIKDFGGKAIVITNRSIKIDNRNIYVFKMDYEDYLTSPIIEILPIELFVNELGLGKGHKPGILSRVVK